MRGEWPETESLYYLSTCIWGRRGSGCRTHAPRARCSHQATAQGPEHRSLDSTDLNPIATVRIPAAYLAVELHVIVTVVPIAPLVLRIDRSDARRHDRIHRDTVAHHRLRARSRVVDKLPCELRLQRDPVGIGLGVPDAHAEVVRLGSAARRLGHLFETHGMVRDGVGKDDQIAVGAVGGGDVPLEAQQGALHVALRMLGHAGGRALLALVTASAPAACASCSRSASTESAWATASATGTKLYP
eukprot:5966811-Prymnesium_polylepis.2